MGELIDLAVEKDIIEKSGSWFSYGGNHIGQGREKTKAYLSEHPEVADEITQKFVIHQRSHKKRKKHLKKKKS